MEAQLIPKTRSVVPFVPLIGRNQGHAEPTNLPRLRITRPAKRRRDDRSTPMQPLSMALHRQRERIDARLAEHRQGRHTASRPTVSECEGVRFSDSWAGGLDAQRRSENLPFFVRFSQGFKRRYHIHRS